MATFHLLAFPRSQEREIYTRDNSRRDLISPSDQKVSFLTGFFWKDKWLSRSISPIFYPSLLYLTISVFKVDSFLIFFLRVDLSHPSPSFRKSRSFSLETESRVPGSRRYTRRRGFIVTSSKVVPWVRLFLNGRRGRIRLRLRPLRFRLRESSSIKNFTEPSRF